MARRPVSKQLWQQLQPLIPAFVPSNKGGPRKRTVSDEAALNGILFVLQTGIPWEDLPQSMGFASGSGMTSWRRLRDWQAADPHIPTQWLEFVIREGRNRQVCRMTVAIGHPTLRLVRAAIGPYRLEDLPSGH